MTKRQKLIDKYPIPWPQEKVLAFRKTLLEWYDAEGRELPWRGDTDPYHVWVSEIMLQQTQVVTVIPYYERFLEALPTIESLANAPEAQLMSLWQGLGYYSRVRNMQTAAQQILQDFDGQMPETMEEIISLKGIGSYTAGAIGSICFNLPEPALDGNLIRVTTRLFEIPEDVTRSATRNKMMAYLYQLIDPDRPGDFNQALMDIGARIMTPANTFPEDSPIKDFDSSYYNKTGHLYPFKPKKIKVTRHHLIAYALLNTRGEWLLRKHEDSELLAQLWHFPLVETSMIFEGASVGEIKEPLVETYELDPEIIEGARLILSDMEAIPQVVHQFSHRHWMIDVIPLQVTENIEAPGGFTWAKLEEQDTVPTSTLQKKMFKVLNINLD